MLQNLFVCLKSHLSLKTAHNQLLLMKLSCLVIVNNLLLSWLT